MSLTQFNEPLDKKCVGAFANAVVKFKFCNCFIEVHNLSRNVTLTAARKSLTEGQFL